MKNTFEKIIKGSFQGEKKEKQFLKITIPIKILDEIKLDDDIKKRIELIDIPGLDTKEANEEKYLENNTFGNLIKFSNGFLFVTKKSEIHTNFNRDIIFIIICKIRNRSVLDFSFDNLFFVLTGEKGIIDNIEDKKYIKK
jgi:hypothetical protein